MRRGLAVLVLVAALLAIAAPATASLRVRHVYRSSCDASGSCTTETRKCLRFRGDRYCTPWRVSGTWIR